ncbi:hypothetical protein ACQW5G_01250 [Fructilactobacillus sp. Tb1]|uniref:hypothetical protein n=1 Tax=Fructilactobacillus sp. Tb1 TaxID=3422304 RepID=UPI003D28C47B
MNTLINLTLTLFSIYLGISIFEKLLSFYSAQKIKQQLMGLMETVLNDKENEGNDKNEWK